MPIYAIHNGTKIKGRLVFSNTTSTKRTEQALSWLEKEADSGTQILIEDKDQWDSLSFFSYYNMFPQDFCNSN